MYGMVNQAIKDLVLTSFGEESWNSICSQAGIPTEDFVFMDYYPDKITYDLVGAASNLLNVPPEAILKEFGKHWVKYTAKEGYGSLMDLFGADFKSCLANLNNLHARMGVTMPHLTPPRFVFRETDASNFELEYHSTRSGLSPMVEGLLIGLAEKFGHQVEIKFSENQGLKLFSVKVIG